MFVLLVRLVSGCSHSPEREAISSSNPYLPDLGQAPELTNEILVNSDQPLQLADLRGQVVMLEMWILGCINCRNVIPSLIEWHHTYSDQAWSSLAITTG